MSIGEIYALALKGVMEKKGIKIGRELSSVSLGGKQLIREILFMAKDGLTSSQIYEIMTEAKRMLIELAKETNGDNNDE